MDLILPCAYCPELLRVTSAHDGPKFVRCSACGNSNKVVQRKGAWVTERTPKT